MIKTICAGLIALNFASPYIRKLSFDYDPAELLSQEIKRVKTDAFKNMNEIFDKIYFKFHSMEGITWKGLMFYDMTDNYWVDKAAYQLSPVLTKNILECTNEIHNMCLEATNFAISDDEILQKVFDIPPDMIPMIRESWNQRQPDMLARYDFLLGFDDKLYFLECNGDTPSGIIESGPAQREWASYQNLPQFNVLEENIKKSFERITKHYNSNEIVLFQNDNIEDSNTSDFLGSLITGNPNMPHAKFLPISQIVHTVRDAISRQNRLLFWRQYPLEWLAGEEMDEIFRNQTFYQKQTQGDNGTQTIPQVGMIEPAWKILMSSKAMSVLLKEMYPNSPYLIDSNLGPYKSEISQLSKQKFGREGEHIFFSDDFGSRTDFLEKSYKGYYYSPIFQKYKENPHHQGRHITLSSWMIQGELSGILVREDINNYIGTGSSVVPYYIDKSIQNKPIKVEIKSTDTQKEIIDSLYKQREYKSNLKEIQIQPVSNNRLMSFFANTFDPIKVKNNLLNQLRESNHFKELSTHNKQPQSQDENGITGEQMLLGFAPIAAAGMMVNKRNNAEQEQQRGSTSGSSSGGGNYTYNNTQKAPQQSVKPAGSTGIKHSSHS